MKLVYYTNMKDILGRILDKIFCRVDGFREEELPDGSTIIYFGKNRGRAFLPPNYDNNADEKHLGVVYG